VGLSAYVPRKNPEHVPEKLRSRHRVEWLATKAKRRDIDRAAQ